MADVDETDHDSRIAHAVRGLKSVPAATLLALLCRIAHAVRGLKYAT